MSRHLIRSSVLIFILALVTACAGKVLQYDRSDELLKNDEFEKKVDIKEVPVEPPPQPVIKDEAQIKADADAEKSKKAAKAKPAPVKPKKEAKKPVGPRQPEMEDSVGFEGRRPKVDPFRVGEKVTLNISYFNIVAGTLDIEVKPFVEVNGRKAYHFEITGKSNSFFSKIYAVDDKAVTYMAYDDLTPLNLQISIKESKQLSETRTLFDWKTMKASYWQKQVTKEKGERSKKIDWDLVPFAQNVISAAYYMRVFTYEPGKTLQFRVADEGKNITFKGEVLRREKLDTEIGKLDTIVMKPVVTVDGIFKPVGDIIVWLTDDDRKQIVRIESKIKIGTVIGKLKALEKGRD